MVLFAAGSRPALGATACESEPNPTADGVRFVPCEVVVKFYPGVDPVPIITAVGTTVLDNLREQLTDSPLNSTVLTQADIPPDIWENADVYRLQVTDPGKTVQQAIVDFLATGDVVFASRNRISRLKAHQPTPNDPLFARKWDLLNVGQTGTGVIDADMDAPQGWQLHSALFGGTVDCRSILIAVMDSGVDFTHPDIAANAWVGPGGINGVNVSVFPPNFDVSDHHGHGTFVSGLIAAHGNNGLDISGVCWRAQIVAIKADAGDGFEAWSTAAGTIASVAYNIAASFLNLPPIRIINMSYGPDIPESDPLNSVALAIADAAGILGVAAAGNSTVNVDGGELGLCSGGGPVQLCADVGITGGDCPAGSTCVRLGGCSGGPTPGRVCSDVGTTGGQCGAGGTCGGRCVAGPTPGIFCTDLGVTGGQCGAAGTCVQRVGRCGGGLTPEALCADIGVLGGQCGIGGLCREVGFVPCQADKDLAGLPPPFNALTSDLICVGASTHTDATATFSNYGPATVHLLAPGERVHSLSATYDIGMNFYRVGGAGGTVAVGDRRLKAVIPPGVTFGIGSLVAAGNPDIGSRLVAVPALVRHTEVTVNGLYDPPNECAYIDEDNNGSVGVGDVRFTSCPGFAPTGGPVATGDTDIGSPLIAFAANEQRTTTRWGNGTSFSSPDVAGLAALCLSTPAFRDLTPAVTRDLMIRFVDRKNGVASGGGGAAASSLSQGRARWMCTADLGDLAQAAGTHDPFGYHTLQLEPFMRLGTPALGATPAHGPVHLDTGNEWLGAHVSNEHNADTPLPRDEDPTANVLPANSDAFDDGFVGFLFLGGGVVGGVRAQVCSDAFGLTDGAGGRYGAGARQVFLNGYFDWNGDGDFDLPNEHNLHVPINPNAIFPIGSFPNSVPPPTRCLVVTAPFVVPAPGPGIPAAWRLRVDYGEDVSGALPFGYRAIDPRPAADHVDIATFGEVEDYVASQATAVPIPYCMVDCRTRGRFGNDAQLACDMVANDPAASFQLGKNVFMADGTTVTGDTVKLLSDASVWNANANTLQQGDGATVRNTTGTPTIPYLDPFPTVTAMPCSGPDVIVGAGQSVTLAPGTYNRVRVARGGTLTLDPAGVFDFCSLRTTRQAAIYVTGSDQTIINIAETMRISNASVLQSQGTVPGPVINVAGRLVRVGRDARLDAYVTAPNALFRVGRAGQINGTFVANECGTDKSVVCGCNINPPGTTTTTVSTTTTTTL
ncbi:MAG TPA: S8 family serine peptidase [Candidatus Binatia bacterium]|nr:S8 family serine peptidase [Candidatus Binatia bacterium]